MLCTSSPEGWTDAQITQYCIETQLLPSTVPSDLGEWPLLIMGSLEAHIDPIQTTGLKEHQVAIAFLPVHTSHFTQPPDVACFAPLKGRYKAAVAALLHYNNSAEVKKTNFGTLCYQATMDAKAWINRTRLQQVNGENR